MEYLPIAPSTFNVPLVKRAVPSMDPLSTQVPTWTTFRQSSIRASFSLADMGYRLELTMLDNFAGTVMPMKIAVTSTQHHYAQFC
jgi:hypothetical protein